MTKKEYIEKYGEEAYQRQLEWNRKYCQQHREERKQRCKQYREQHREENKQYQKQYREQHRDEIKQYKKQHREEYKQHQKQWNRKHIHMFAYCIPEQIEQVENYQFAKKDNFDGWCIHHRLETHNSDGEKRLVNLSRDELIALDMYYNRPANELVFLTASEHMKLHKINRISKANA